MISDLKAAIENIGQGSVYYIDPDDGEVTEIEGHLIASIHPNATQAGPITVDVWDIQRQRIRNITLAAFFDRRIEAEYAAKQYPERSKL